MKNILIIGAVGHGPSIAEVLQFHINDFNIVGFLDDSKRPGSDVGRYKVLDRADNLSQYLNIADSIIVGIGNNEIRKAFINDGIAAGFEFPTVIHPRAVISPSSVIGKGTAIMANAIVGANTILGAGVIVNSGANIDHDCIAEDFSHLGANACMAGGSRLGNSAWLYPGVVLSYSTTVGPGKIINTSER